jgi:hypothetical protein
MCLKTSFEALILLPGLLKVCRRLQDLLHSLCVVYVYFMLLLLASQVSHESVPLFILAAAQEVAV